jgi:hypothetical protein
MLSQPRVIDRATDPKVSKERILTTHLPKGKLEHNHSLQYAYQTSSQYNQPCLDQNFSQAWLSMVDCPTSRNRSDECRASPLPTGASVDERACS